MDAAIARAGPGVQLPAQLVEGIVLPASTFIDRGAELFRSQPVQDVRFFAIDRAMVQLAACSHLAQLRTIDLSSVYFAGNAGFRALLSSHHLGRLRVLRMATPTSVMTGCAPWPSRRCCVNSTTST